MAKLLRSLGWALALALFALALALALPALVVLAVAAWLAGRVKPPVRLPADPRARVWRAMAQAATRPGRMH